MQFTFSGARELFHFIGDLDFILLAPGIIVKNLATIRIISKNLIKKII